jgi:hypothetical protein
MDLACSGSYMISYIVFMVEAMWSMCTQCVIYLVGVDYCFKVNVFSVLFVHAIAGVLFEHH